MLKRNKPDSKSNKHNDNISINAGNSPKYDSNKNSPRSGKYTFETITEEVDQLEKNMHIEIESPRIEPNDTKLMYLILYKKKTV